MQLPLERKSICQRISPRGREGRSCSISWSRGIALPSMGAARGRAGPWGAPSSPCTAPLGAAGPAQLARGAELVPGAPAGPLGTRASLLPGASCRANQGITWAALAREELAVEKPHCSRESSRRRGAPGESSGGGRGAFGDAKLRAWKKPKQGQKKHELK